MPTLQSFWFFDYFIWVDMNFIFEIWKYEDHQRYESTQFLLLHSCNWRFMGLQGFIHFSGILNLNSIFVLFVISHHRRFYVERMPESLRKSSSTICSIYVPWNQLCIWSSFFNIESCRKNNSCANTLKFLTFWVRR